jgi:uncharacterized protein YndB with AHSA1/START domain
MPMLGDLAPAGERWRLTFVRHYPHPVEKVWRAVTEPDHLRVWFPADIEGERAAGAPLRFVFREDEGPTLEGEILAYEPPTLVEYRWSEEVLRFELAPDGDGCRLTFVNTFGDIGKAARDAAGWHGCLDVLEVHLAGGTPSAATRERWKEIHADYVAAFPAEAATIGPPGG